MAAIVIDLGFIYLTRRQMQAAVNTAALERFCDFATPFLDCHR